MHRTHRRLYISGIGCIECTITYTDYCADRRFFLFLLCPLDRRHIRSVPSVHSISILCLFADFEMLLDLFCQRRTFPTPFPLPKTLLRIQQQQPPVRFRHTGAACLSLQFQIGFECSIIAGDFQCEAVEQCSAFCNGKSQSGTA